MSSAAWSILANAPIIPHLTSLDLAHSCAIDLADFQKLILNHIDTLRRLKISYLSLPNGTSEAIGRFYEALVTRCELEFFSHGPLRFDLTGFYFRLPASLVTAKQSHSVVWEGREKVKIGMSEMAKVLKCEQLSIAWID